MSAYLIMGAELAALYALFWYIFLREPDVTTNNAALIDTCQAGRAATMDCTTYSAKVASFPPPSWQNGSASKNFGKSARPNNFRQSDKNFPSLSKPECSCSISGSHRRSARLTLAGRPDDAWTHQVSPIEKLCLYVGRKLIQFSLKLR